MFVVPCAHRETVRNLPGIEHRTLAGGDDGLKRLSVWEQAITRGMLTPPHRHDCEEVVLVTKGRGELHIGGEVHSFAEADVLIIPANAEHQIVNSGNDTLKLIAALSSSPVVAHFPNGDVIPLPWKT